MKATVAAAAEVVEVAMRDSAGRVMGVVETLATGAGATALVGREMEVADGVKMAEVAEARLAMEVVEEEVEAAAAAAEVEGGEPAGAMGVKGARTRHIDLLHTRETLGCNWRQRRRHNEGSFLPSTQRSSSSAYTSRHRRSSSRTSPISRCCGPCSLPRSFLFLCTAGRMHSSFRRIRLCLDLHKLVRHSGYRRRPPQAGGETTRR